jgi:hypothetical protein
MATKQELQALNIKLTEQLCTANIELAHLRAQLADRDALAKKLIAGHNRAAKSPRRAAMEAARAEAMKTGTVTKVQQGELHV